MIRRFNESFDDVQNALYLLRTDVQEPFSTDVWVWPSLFNVGGTQHGIPVPKWIGPNAGLWGDLKRMKAYLAKQRPAEPPPHWIIAVSWHADADLSFEPRDGGPYLEPTEPPDIDPTWQCLGFDVSDGSLLSGLSNCGYSPYGVKRMRARWGPLLNAHHLFDDVEVARAFRDRTDLRVREHAPFHVYGLWRIEAVSAGGST